MERQEQHSNNPKHIDPHANAKSIVQQVADLVAPLYALEGDLILLNLALATSADPCQECHATKPCGFRTELLSTMYPAPIEEAIAPFGHQWSELNALHLAVLDLQDAISYALEAHEEQRLLKAQSFTGIIPCSHRSVDDSTCK